MLQADTSPCDRAVIQNTFEVNTRHKEVTAYGLRVFHPTNAENTVTEVRPAIVFYENGRNLTGTQHVLRKSCVVLCSFLVALYRPERGC